MDYYQLNFYSHSDFNRALVLVLFVVDHTWYDTWYNTTTIDTGPNCSNRLYILHACQQREAVL